MIAARRTMFETGAAAPALSFIRWRGRNYLRIETARGVLLHDGKNLLRRTQAAGPSQVDTFEHGSLLPGDVEEPRPLLRDPGPPDRRHRDRPDLGPPVPDGPDARTPSASDREAAQAHPENEDSSPGW